MSRSGGSRAGFATVVRATITAVAIACAACVGGPPAATAMRSPGCASANSNGKLYTVDEFLRLESPPPGLYSVDGWVDEVDSGAGRVVLVSRGPFEEGRRRKLTVGVADDARAGGGDPAALRIGYRYYVDVRVDGTPERRAWLVGCGRD